MSKRPFTRILTTDFETRWNTKTGYTLKKMTTEEYLRDPRFKVFGCGVHYYGADCAPQWVSGKNLPEFFKTVDWATTAVMAHNCVTGDHEVRTRKGWVRFDELEDGVDVLQWDPATEALTYTPAVVVRKAYQGTLYTWNTSYHKGTYTADHRMYVCTSSKSQFFAEHASRVARRGQNNTYVPTAGIWQPEKIKDVTSLEARVIEMCRADGNITPLFDVRFSFKKERKITRCLSHLTNLNVPHTVRKLPNGVTTIKTRAHARMRELAGWLGVGKTKCLGGWVLDIPTPARAALLDETAFWDGSVTTTGGTAQTRIATAVREDARWLVELAVLTGRSAKATYDVPNTRGLSREDSVLHVVRVRQRSRAKLLTPPAQEEFSGTVYCLSTPTSAFAVRRNGVTWMTGNCQFDASILSWHYGIKPAFILDTLSMARATRGVEAGNSAEKLALAFGLPAKGKALHSTNGLDELTPEIERELADYCIHDVWLCEQFADRLLPHFPSKELRLIDMTVRMYAFPVLTLDENMLVDSIHEEKDTREDLLRRIGMAQADLASDQKFAQALQSLGIEPPTKISKKTGKRSFAFAKNDALFQQLLNSEREDVALLCEARVSVRSTIQRTRAQRFLDISRRGPLPVPLSYFGAGTSRWTAAKGSAINLQNLKRKSFLRKAIMAPIDHVLGVVDLSQIEPRVLAWLADYHDLLDIFRAGGDPYAMFGAQMFNIPGLTKESHSDLRQSAKAALLGAGYGLGWQNFAQQLLTGFLGAPPVRYDREFAKRLGVTGEYVRRFLDWDVNIEKMAAINRTCTDEELLIHCVAAKKIIEKYRDTAQPVVAFWAKMQELIEWSLYKGNEVTLKCLTFRKEQIILPSGMPMNYPALQYTTERGEKQWHYGEKETKLYGGKVTNNCLAAGTQVLTERGWMPIELISPDVRVHDGVEFVQHGGKVFNGVQSCAMLDGVAMTPDHLVLTDDGWTQASQVQRPHRPDLRHVDGNKPGVKYWEKVGMALRLPVWKTSSKSRRERDQGIAQGRFAKLRMQYSTLDRRQEHHARNVNAPGVCCVAQYGQPLHQAFGPGVQKLRCAWHQGVHRVAEFVRAVLGAHGAYVPAWAGLGSQKQQRKLHPCQLSLDFAPRKFDESSHYGARCGRSGTERSNWNCANYTVRTHQGRLADGEINRSALFQAPVFDIMNCGPRSRFVVLGAGGPFIVHNCTQGTARCVMTDGLLRVDKRYSLVNTVHDEGVAVVPVRDAAIAKPWMIEQMTLEPPYMPGIPLAADGGVHKRYGLAKD